MEDEFKRTIEAVFEERVETYSPELRHLLRNLWSEGVKHGRLMKRTETHRIEQTQNAFSLTAGHLRLSRDIIREPSEQEHRRFKREIKSKL